MDKKALVNKGMVPDCTCCDSTFRILPNGEWCVFFMTGGNTEPEPENYVALCRSTDGGVSWGEKEYVIRNPNGGCTLSEVWIDGEAITMQVSFHAGFFEQWRNYTIVSRDNGHTWSEPEVFAPLPRRGFVRNRYRATWGEWIVPYQYYEPAGDIDTSPRQDNTFNEMWVGTVLSPDEGKTWIQSNRIRGHDWAEPNTVELSDGKLVMFLRWDGSGCLWRSESTDRGRTWSEAVRTEIPNPGTKFRLFRLRDGRIVLVHNPNSATSHPNSKRQAHCHRNPLALWVSDDDMETWGYRRTLTDFPGMLAYPDGVVDEKEEYLHFAFDYNRHDVIYWGARLPAPGEKSPEA